mgnify:CR=1 FL=1
MPTFKIKQKLKISYPNHVGRIITKNFEVENRTQLANIIGLEKAQKSIAILSSPAFFGWVLSIILWTAIFKQVGFWLSFVGGAIIIFEHIRLLRKRVDKFNNSTINI